jgi:hypothetical protein
MRQTYLIIGALALTLMLSSCAKQPEAVGGQRDEHGCLGPAGYSYNEDIGACVRTWEIDDEGKSRAAKAAVDYVVENGMDRFALTVTKFDVMRCGGDAPARCVGGYNVYLERTYDTIEHKIVHLSNWEATSAEDYTP